MSETCRGKLSVLAQVCQLIPSHLVAKLSREHRVRWQSFSPWSHVTSMIYAQVSHAFGLNDVCDGLQNHEGELGRIRRATAPRRNTLSNANMNRPASMAEDLFWSVYEHLQSQSPGFGHDRMKMPRRFKRTISLVDSTTISLVANCMDWAKHRKRKAAAKIHLRLNLQTFLPGYVRIKEAKPHDSKFAWELCAGLQSGEIVVFDMAYIDFEHLQHLNDRGVYWITREKENLSLRCHKHLLDEPKGKILRDELVYTTGLSKAKYPTKLRRVTALIEERGVEKEMAFLTNNLDWAPSSIADLYKSRWYIESFFKEIKQTLQLSDFMGNSKNAIQWQVWTALLTYLLLRYIKFLSQWNHSFTRLFTFIRGILWSKLQLYSILQLYGTAGRRKRIRAAPEQAYLPGFSKWLMGQQET